LDVIPAFHRYFGFDGSWIILSYRLPRLPRRGRSVLKP
jgi:hypothetical protein